METLYRIVFSGQLAPGKRPQDVIPALAAKFRMRQEQARAILLKGTDQTLKQNLTAAKAERYDQALTELGLVVRIEAQEPEDNFDQPSVLRAHPLESDSAEAGPDSSAPVASQAAAHAGEGSGSRCPKCGAYEVSALTGVCQACGVVVERYLEKHGLSGEVPPPPPTNPYAPPRARSAALRSGTTASADTFHEPSSVPAGRGFGWIADAWGLFKAQPIVWIGALVLFYLIVVVVSLVPLVGSLATTLLGPMLSAGLMMGAHAQAQGARLELSHLFAGINTRAGPLALVGLVYLLLMIALAVLIVVLMMLLAPALPGLGAMSGQSPDTLDPAAMQQIMTSPTLLLPILIGLALGIPLAMAILFAPALVAIDGVGVLSAFWLSLRGCLKNILPFLLYGIAALGLFILGMIPLGLGLLVVLPLLFIALYSAYRDIYHA